MAHIAEFMRSIEDGTADEGARMALWHLIKVMNGRAVIDYGEPPLVSRFRSSQVLAAPPVRTSESKGHKQI
jgi:hypothetical protein